MIKYDPQTELALAHIAMRENREDTANMVQALIKFFCEELAKKDAEIAKLKEAHSC